MFQNLPVSSAVGLLFLGCGAAFLFFVLSRLRRWDEPESPLSGATNLPW